MKHLALDFHFVREKVQLGSLRVTHVSGDDQLADVHTKPLLRPRFQLLNSKIGLASRSSILRWNIGFPMVADREDKRENRRMLVVGDEEVTDNSTHIFQFSTHEFLEYLQMNFEIRPNEVHHQLRSDLECKKKQIVNYNGKKKYNFKNRAKVNTLRPTTINKKKKEERGGKYFSFNEFDGEGGSNKNQTNLQECDFLLKLAHSHDPLALSGECTTLAKGESH
ncbi:hypothetical protein OSB04_023756, partial [Centaurea solstitialis]